MGTANIPDEMMRQLASLSARQMQATSVALETAFPSANLDIILSGALGIQIATLLNGLDDDESSHLVEVINRVLRQFGYALTTYTGHVAGHA